MVWAWVAVVHMSAARVKALRVRVVFRAGMLNLHVCDELDKVLTRVLRGHCVFLRSRICGHELAVSKEGRHDHRDAEIFAQASAQQGDWGVHSLGEFE